MFFSNLRTSKISVICAYLFIKYAWNNNILKVLLDFGQLKSPKIDRKSSKTGYVCRKLHVWYHLIFCLENARAFDFTRPNINRKKDWKAKFSGKKLRFHSFILILDIITSVREKRTEEALQYNKEFHKSQWSYNFCYISIRPVSL